MLYEYKNYTADIQYLTNTFVREYDISKANINVLYSNKVIDKNTYEYLYNAERMTRQIFVGKLQQGNPEVTDILQNGIIEAKKQLFESNYIKDYEVLSIKNDAVFIIDRQLKYTDFGLIKFLCKNQYTSFYRINNLELYYYYNTATKEENIDIKGISDEKLKLHDKYMLQLIKDIFYAIQVLGVENAIKMLKDFYFEYINYQLPVEYYRNFNTDSMYRYKFRSKYTDLSYYLNNATDNIKRDLDINYNLSIITALQKILMSIYFNNHRMQ